MIETEFPLYGEIGTTVTAQAKAYDHYHVNESAQGAVMFGTVEAPTAGSDGAPQILTLRVCYDLELLTVAYELNGGKGADSVDYGTVTVKYGDSVLVKAAPTREVYFHRMESRK